MRKKKKAQAKGNTPMVALRLTEEMQERLAAMAQRMSEAQPGVTFTRSDAMRVLLVRGLDADEEKAKR